MDSNDGDSDVVVHTVYWANCSLCDVLYEGETRRPERCLSCFFQCQAANCAFKTAKMPQAVIDCMIRFMVHPGCAFDAEGVQGFEYREPW